MGISIQLTHRIPMTVHEPDRLVQMSRVFAGVLMALAACHFPGAPNEGGDYARDTVELTAITPTLAGGGAQIYAAAGKTLIGTMISRDSGVTWTGINAAIDPASIQAIDEDNFVCQTSAFGLGRWTIHDDQVVEAHAPFNGGLFRAIPTTGTIIQPQPGQNVIARGTKTNVWTQVTLIKPPAASSSSLNVSDTATNGMTTLVTSAWGVYRSIDDGVSWELVKDAPAASTDVLAQLVALDDGRFVAFADSRVGTVFDTSGMPTGQTTPVFPNTPNTHIGGSPPRRLACLGAIIDGDQVTHDLGQTFEPLVPTGTFHTLLSTCTTGEPAALIANVVRMGFEQAGPFYTTTMTELGAFGAVLPVVPATTAATNFHLLPSGTVFANDQSWKQGDATWRLAPLAASSFFLRDGSVIYFTADDVMRSTNDGTSYTATPRVTKMLTFTSIVQDAGGKLYGSTMIGGTLQWLYTSTDLGATWTQVTQTTPVVTTPPAPYVGQALTLMRVVDDGTLVAREGTAIAFVSSDGGVTWRGERFPSGFAYFEVTPDGVGITFELEDSSSVQPAWHLWEDYGAGLAIEQIIPQMMGTPVNVGDAGANIALDKSGYMYMTGGGVPLVFKTDKRIGD
ncbi:hypothetical protein BH11MYX2_BH11MYX2_00770 [soil metagenome]